MILILIPAYNEEKNIEETIKSAHSNLKRMKHKIFVINDGSHDNTLNILKKLIKKHPLKLLNHKANLGVDSAFITGIKTILKEGKDGDVVVIMEADGTSDPTLLPKMVSKIINGYDLAIASRYVKGGMYKGFPFKRLLISKVGNFILKNFTSHNKSIKDFTIFYRAYKFKLLREAYDMYDKNLITTKYFTANAELLIKLSPLIKKVYEVPFVYDYSIKKSKSGLTIGKNLEQYFILLRGHNRFVKF